MRPGRKRALLLFVSLSLTVLVSLVGIACTSATTTPPSYLQPKTVSVTLYAADLGAGGSTSPNITSPCALVVNLDSGVVLYQRNPMDQRAMASTTKMMTAVVVLESMELSTQVTISQQVVDTWEKQKWVRPGDVLTVEQLLYALMVPSANQAAVALAQAYPGGESAFVQRMNTKAAELGMTGTHYVNPHGLDPKGAQAGQHYSTARDLAILARYAMLDGPIGETFRKLVSTREYGLQIDGHEGVEVLQSTNELLNTLDWIIGVKTGETPEAKTCLVAAAERDGLRVLSVVLGQPEHARCFTESRTLLDYGLSQYSLATILEKGEAVAEAVIPFQDESLRLVASEAVEAHLFKGQSVTATMVIDRPVVLPVEAGEVFGRVELLVDGADAGSVDLVAEVSVGETTLGQKLSFWSSGSE